MKKLNTLTDLDEALAASNERPVLLFKHSTRCPISHAADRNYQAFVQAHGDLDVLFTHLDLIAHRDLSSAIEEKLHVPHQSPQVILVKDGEAVWHASHMSITEDALEAALQAKP